MKGGIAAIEGFDYQATAILEIILQYIQSYPTSVQFRPEGKDDLEISWIESNGQREQCHYQFKKISNLTTRNSQIWSISDIARELLPAALKNIANSSIAQIWVLGDSVAPGVRRLLAAGTDAPDRCRNDYLLILHRLAKGRTNCTEKSKLKASLDQYKPIAQPANSISENIESMIRHFIAKAVDVEFPKLKEYEQAVQTLHQKLPAIFSKIQVRDNYGTEVEVARRVIDKLEQDYHLNRTVIQHTLFRNLRGFISDVSKEVGRTISKADLEFELTSVWPQMIVMRNPPVLDAGVVRRPDIVEAVIASASMREVVGPSGAGKTILASEVMTFLESQASPDIALYAEVSRATSMRDVAVGLAFRLRRRGIDELMSVAVDREGSDEAMIDNILRVCRLLTRRIVLLVDLIEGEASVEFARQLTYLARRLNDSALQIILFSQRSLLHDLSDFERQSANIQELHLRGLHPGEFNEMLRYYHPNVDSSRLYRVFLQLTAGRTTGILPSEAVALARLPSIDKMERLAALPPAQRLIEAHEARFLELPQECLPAARRLLCFSLPLTESEAESLFPTEPIRMAVRHLIRAGLIRRAEDSSIEVHETVRAGLASQVPAALAADTHQRLAHHFGERGNLPAQIHHLELAGRKSDALALARQRFLSGSDWRLLWKYVGEHKLLTDKEIFSLLLEEKRTELYVLPDLLSIVRVSDTGQQLFSLITTNAGRFDTDHSWALSCSEALLLCEPSMLAQLAWFAMLLPIQDREMDSRIEIIIHAMERKGVKPDDKFVTYYRIGVAPSQQRRLLPILLVFPDGERLKLAFDYMQQEGIPPGVPYQLQAGQGTSVRLRIHSLTEIDAFIATLPQQNTSKIMTKCSPCLERFESYVWVQREILRKRCKELLEQSGNSESILVNAMRILIHVGDMEVISLARQYQVQKEGPISQMALLVPGLLKANSERQRLAEIVLNPRQDSGRRMFTLWSLIAIGEHLGEIFQSICENIPEERRGVRITFLGFAAQHPYPEVVPILADIMKEADAETEFLIGHVLMRIAELDRTDVNNLLLQALSHSRDDIKRAALAALALRRDPRTLQSALQIAATGDKSLGRLALVAAVASGPESIEPFREIWSRHPNALSWRCVLAARLKVSQESQIMEEMATNQQAHWKERRSAILALGCMPEPQGLLRVAPQILAESDSLPDNHVAFYHHDCLSSIMASPETQKAVIHAFSSSKADFDGLVVCLCTFWMQHTPLSMPHLNTGTVIGWLWDRLLELRLTVTPEEALRRIENEIHVPLIQDAVVRALRMHARRDELQSIVRSDCSIWLMVRAYKALYALTSTDENILLEQLVTNARGERASLLSRWLDIYKSQQARKATGSTKGQIHSSSKEPLPSRVMNFSEACQFITSQQQVDSMPIVLDLSESEFRDLLSKLNPKDDTKWIIPKSQRSAQLSLGMTDATLVDALPYPEGRNFSQRLAMRASLVAANKYGQAIPWKLDALTGSLGQIFSIRLLKTLGAQGDPRRLIDELQQNADILVQYICSHDVVQYTVSICNSEMVEVLSRYANSGNIEFLEKLCLYVSNVNGPAVDSILKMLFARLIGRLSDYKEQGQAAITKWLALSHLARNSRFGNVPGLVDRLASLLSSHKLADYQAMKIIQIFRAQPSSYAQIEKCAFHSTVFGHYEKDLLDVCLETAEALFRSISVPAREAR